jgi:hypothetical protein
MIADTATTVCKLLVLVLVTAGSAVEKHSAHLVEGLIARI